MHASPAPRVSAQSDPSDPDASAGSGADESEVQQTVERHQRTIEVLTQTGWVAKGIVYLLFGMTAIAIARQSTPTEEASPKGSLSLVFEAPAGRVLMGALAVGLALYAVWRLASVALVDGTDHEAWAHRIGYAFSAVFATTLSYASVRAAWSGSQSDDSSTVETLSTTLLEHSVGRWLLAVGGVTTIGVGLYFAVHKGIRRSFADDLTGLTTDGRALRGGELVVWLSGIAGWIGRGVVTALVGFFVVRAAIQFDPAEARGFDRALREITSTTVGSLLAWVAAVGLVCYGVFCLISVRRRDLDD